MATKNYIHPVTGKACTSSEYNAALTTEASPTTTTPTGGNVNPYTGQPFTTADLSGMGVATTADFWNFYNQGLIQEVGGQYKYVGEAGVVGTGGWGENVPTPYNVPGTPTTIATPTAETPTFDPTAIPAPTIAAPPAVTPAPPYEKTPEQIAWEEQYLGKLEPWLEAEGYGIPEETKTLMVQRETDALKAREVERIRVMRNTMERRGLTNSGLLFSEGQKIKSDTTYALAKSITDIEIKSAFMKMASFEKAMGASALFLGYLSEQAQLAYAPTLATWEMEENRKMQEWLTEQQAKLAGWQASVDVYKIELNQAYTQGNIQLTAQLQAQAASQQHIWDVEMLEMEMEAANQQAVSEGFFGLIGTIATITL